MTFLLLGIISDKSVFKAINFEEEPVLTHGPYDYDKVLVKPTLKRK